MKTKSQAHLGVPVSRQEGTPRSKPTVRWPFRSQVAVAGALVLMMSWVVVIVADEDDRAAASWLRQFIGEQVGGVDTLKVPATNAEIPLPRQADGTVNPRFETTEAKRFLGKMLFHDPVRSARINISEGQPVDLPAGTAFGGTVSASDPNIQAIVNAERQDSSCGS